MLFSDTQNDHKAKNTKYFKFDNWLLEQKGFVDMVESWWSSFIVEVSLDFILAKKLKILKLKLKEWSKEAAENYETRKKDLQEKIENMDRIVEDREFFLKKKRKEKKRR